MDSIRLRHSLLGLAMASAVMATSPALAADEDVSATLAGMRSDAPGASKDSKPSKLSGLFGRKFERQKERVGQRTDNEADQASDRAVDKTMDKVFNKIFGD